MNQRINDVSEKIYIIILNYNSANDTLECLCSLSNIKLVDKSQIILVDNKSTDDSTNVIKNFLQDKFSDYVCYKKNKTALNHIHGIDLGSNIVFIESDENNGFSAGNNIAIDYINAKKDGSYFWFLNNDTIQDKYALSEMIRFLKNESLVLTSSVLYDYTMPRKIQAIGISMNRPIYTMPIVGKDDLLVENEKISSDYNGKRTTYDDVYNYYPDIFALPGASFLLSREGLELIGGRLDESYQFYFEEADIARKIKGRARYAPCLSSVVWHKGGGSSGSRGNYFTSYHTARSRAIFVKRTALIDLPLAVLFIFIRALYCWLQGRCDESRGMLVGLVHGFLYKH